MEPQIRYAKTPDGVRLAWYMVGSGIPFLWMPAGPYTNIHREWEIPETRELLARIAERVTLVRYDARGFSFSDRHSTDFSLETTARDLEAIVDATGFRSLVVQTPAIMSIPALVYASRHPQRLAALIMMSGTARGNDARVEFERVIRVARTDWEVAKRWVGGAARGWTMNATADALGDMLGRSATQDAYIHWHQAALDWDATHALSDVTTPALVTSVPAHAAALWYAPDASRRLAMDLPNAKFVTFETQDEHFRASAEFLAPLLAGLSTPDAPATVRTVLFTDLVGHTEMMRRLGDDRGRDVLREHERITRDLLRQHGGTEVKTMGDGFMASFASVTKAVDCAIALQQTFSNLQLPTSSLQIRVGLNAGEPIEEDGDLFGSTVIMASRICALAGPGEILIPEPLRHLLSGKSYVYADRGDVVLKGFEDPVRLYEVRWRA